MFQEGGGVGLEDSTPTRSDPGGEPERRLPLSFLVSGRPTRAPSRLAVVAWLAIAVCLAAGAVVASTAAGDRLWHKPTFTGFDEQAHFDYVVHLSHGDVPGWGQLYAPDTVHILDCVGLNRTVAQPCVTTAGPRRYPPAGYSYEAQQPPLAYVAYVPFLRPGAAPAAQLESVRRGGVVWLALAAILLVALAWLSDLTVPQMVLLQSACILNPMAIQAAGTVTNDSPGLAAGAASMVAALLLRRRRPAVAVPAALAVGAVLGLMKAFFLIAPLALLVGALLLERPRDVRSSPRAFLRRNATELCMVLGATISTVAFLLYQNHRATVAPSVVLRALLGGQTTHLPRWSTLELSVEHAFTAFQAYVPTSVLPLFAIWGVLVYGSAAGLLLNRSTSRARALRALAGGTLIAAVALDVGFPLLDYLQGHFNYYAPSRYLLPLVPILAYVVARALRPAALVVVGVVLPALAVGSLLFAPI
ncbi:MAG TPA: hypothetical protein VFH58_03400 [Acidimicrobiales bacterium]|nr:hypothetical protein [Acidimicrobiales bacterium]